jgi:hypothetical protein
MFFAIILSTEQSTTQDSVMLFLNKQKINVITSLNLPPSYLLVPITKDHGSKKERKKETDSD